MMTPEQALEKYKEFRKIYIGTESEKELYDMMDIRRYNEQTYDLYGVKFTVNTEVEEDD